MKLNDGTEVLLFGIEKVWKMFFESVWESCNRTTRFHPQVNVRLLYFRVRVLKGKNNLYTLNTFP